MQRTPPRNLWPQRAAKKVGGQSELARRLSAYTGPDGKQPARPVTAQGVGGWCRSGVVPPTRVIAVEAVTGISRKLLRPDLYPSQPAVESEVA